MKNFYPFILFIFFVACGEDYNEKVPAGVIKKEKMAEILADVHIAEAKLSTLSLPADSFNITAIKYYLQVFEKHEITKEEFQRSFDFYSKNPDIMRELYGPVMEKLNIKEGKAWDDDSQQ